MPREAVQVFLPGGIEDVELCMPLNPDDDQALIERIDGRRHTQPDVPIEVRLVKEDEKGRPLKQSDAPWYVRDSLIFRERAIDALGDILLQHGELLPLRCEEAELHIYNPWILPDALDEGRSEIVRFDDGRIMHIEQYVFREEIVRGVDIFKLGIMRASPTLFSRRFVKRWRDSGLWGLDFDLLWEGLGHRLN